MVLCRFKNDNSNLGEFHTYCLDSLLLNDYSLWLKLFNFSETIKNIFEMHVDCIEFLLLNKSIYHFRKTC